MIGRDRELQLLRVRLGSPGAHVQIVGPPGMGKSTVARAVVPADAVWVDLEEASDPVTAVSEALDVPATASVVRAALAAVDWLVLDGAESHAARLPALLETWAGPRIVLTSRVRIAAGSTLELGPLEPSEATEVFRARADALVSGIDLSMHGESIEALVEWLGCWPLAVEIAASRIRLYSPAELLEEARRGDAGAGLEAALQTSWERLGDSTRDALTAAARFCGTFDRDAFTEVCGPLGELEILLDASFVRWTETPEGRAYHLLAPIRSFVRATGGTQGADAYAEHVLEKASATLRGYGGDCRPWVADLESLASRADAVGARAMVCLAENAVVNGPLEPTLRRVLTVDRAPLPPVLAHELRLAECELRLRLGDGAGALAILDPDATDARSLHLLGSAHFRALQIDEARSAFEAALAAADAQGDPIQAAHTEFLFGSMQMRLGEPEGAEVSLRRALERIRPLNEPALEASIEKFLAMHARECGSPPALRVRRLRRSVQLLTDNHRGRLASSARARLVLALADAMDPTALELADEVERESLRAGIRVVTQEVRLIRAMILLGLGRDEEAESALAAARHDAAPWILASADMLESVVLQRQGDPVGASRAIARSIEGFREERLTLDVPIAQCFQVLIEGRLPTEPIAPATPLQRAALEVVTAEVMGAAVPERARELCETTVDVRLMLSLGGVGKVEVGADGTWFSSSEGRVDLTRKRVLRRVLQVLAEAASRDVEVVTLLRRAWPDERPSEASGRARVHVAIGELRKLGLRDVLHTTEGGYRLQARVTQSS